MLFCFVGYSVKGIRGRVVVVIVVFVFVWVLLVHFNLCWLVILVLKSYFV